MNPSEKTSAMPKSPDTSESPDTMAYHPAAGTPGPPTPSLVGQTLNGAYRIEEKLGEGGMGVVYRATQITLGRIVAVKTILSGHATEDTAVQRFFREARLLSQISHPNIVQVIDFGTTEPDRVHFMVMEFLRGQALEDFVTRNPQITGEMLLGLMAQLCEGVQAAHQNHVIHRDLKPSNIFLTNATGNALPIVKILDFGLAKPVAQAKPITNLTQTGMLMGSLGYSAPEQMQDSTTVDVRADVYSIGAILYFLVTGRAPYQGSTLQSLLVKQMTQPPEPIDLAQARFSAVRCVEPIIRRAMDLDPKQRYATPTELLVDLEGACRIGDTSSNRKMPSWIGKAHGEMASPNKQSRRRFIVGAGAAAIGAGIVGGGWWLASLLRSGRTRSDDNTAPAATTAPGVSATEIVFGMSAPFSGPAKELGRAMRTGIDTCFQSVNEAGGIFGRKLRVLALDDGYEPARAEANMKKLLEDHQVFGFIGNVGTPTTEKALPLALNAKRIFFGAYTGAGLLRRDPPDRYVFNYRASYAEETAAIIHYLVTVKHIPAPAIAVFAQKDGYGDSGFAGVAKAVRKFGFDPDQILRVGYERNTTDVAEAVARIVQRGKAVQAIVMVATYQPAARFIKDVVDAKIKPIFANISFVGSLALAETLRGYGPQYPAGVVVTQVVPYFGAGATAVLQYRESLQKYFTEEMPDFVSLEGYLSATILVQALKNAGANLTTEVLVQHLEEIHNWDVGIGTPITYGPSEHQGSHKIWGTVIGADGQFSILDME